MLLFVAQCVKIIIIWQQSFEIKLKNMELGPLMHCENDIILLISAFFSNLVVKGSQYGAELEKEANSILPKSGQKYLVAVTPSILIT